MAFKDYCDPCGSFFEDHFFHTVCYLSLFSTDGSWQKKREKKRKKLEFIEMMVWNNYFKSIFSLFVRLINVASIVFLPLPAWCISIWESSYKTANLANCSFKYSWSITSVTLHEHSWRNNFRLRGDYLCHSMWRKHATLLFSKTFFVIEEGSWSFHQWSGLSCIIWWWKQSQTPPHCARLRPHIDVGVMKTRPKRVWVQHHASKNQL